MKTIPTFKINCMDTYTPQGSFYIEESSLTPGDGFLPEERQEIAALHATHLQEYMNSGYLSIPLTIVLKVGQIEEKTPATCNSKTSNYISPRGNSIIVQTLFSPTAGSDYVVDKSTTIKVIQFNGSNYTCSQS